MGNMYSFVQPRNLSMGPGSLRALEGVVNQRDPQKVLLVTGPHVQRLKLHERVLAAMGSFAARVEIFTNPQPDPDVETIEECARIVREKEYDLIIGLGGGSPMDVAKGAAVVAVHEEMRPLLGRNLLRRRGIPTILIPTTAGSGTEVTQAVVAYVPEEGTKKAIWDPRTMAEAAVIDPELSRDMPPELTAETGVDALIHALEGHTSGAANPLTRMFTGEALRLLGRYLVRAYRNGADMEAREAMARGAALAGLGMTNSGLGAVHALGLVFDRLGFTHARSLAVLAPWVVRFNAAGHEEIYAETAGLLGEDVRGLSAAKAAQKASGAVLRLLAGVNIFPYLKDYGIKENDLESLARRAHEVGQRLMDMNIRAVAPEDAIAIFREAYGGRKDA